MLTREVADERLRRCLMAALNDKHTYGMFERHALGSLTHLGVSEPDALNFVRTRIRNAQIPELYEFERRIHDDLTGLGAYRYLGERFVDRAADWFSVMEPYIEACANGRSLRVLDYGGGSGEVAVRLRALGHHVTIADVIDWRKGDAREIPYVRINRATQFAQEYDLVIAITVIHHALDVSRAVELITTAAPQALIIESVTNTHLEFKYGAAIDHMYNRWFAYNDNPKKKIPVPCHFDSDHGWMNKFWSWTGREAIVSQDLGIYMRLNPEHHHLFLFG